jgi:acyl-CoA thioester hydrolase
MNCPRNLIRIKPEWIDHNGHLNVAYFVLAFDFATDAVYEEWKIGFTYQEQSGCSVFTLGMNVDYHKELFVDEEVEIRTQLLDWDHKRIHYFHTMHHSESGELAATNECLGMNIDLGRKKSASFPEQVQQFLAAIHEQHARMKLPENCGRRLAIERKPHS